MKESAQTVGTIFFFFGAQKNCRQRETQTIYSRHIFCPSPDSMNRLQASSYRIVKYRVLLKSCLVTVEPKSKILKKFHQLEKSILTFKLQ